MHIYLILGQRLYDYRGLFEGLTTNKVCVFHMQMVVLDAKSEMVFHLIIIISWRVYAML